jgi:hypothetical protein
MSAVVVVVVASGALNTWAWLAATEGPARFVIVALVLACEILGAALLMRMAGAFRSGAWVRLALGVPLLAGVVAFNAWSGHRGFELIEAARLAPIRAAATAQADIGRVDAALAAIPAIPLSDEAGRPIGPARTAELGVQRAADIARLERRRSEAAAAKAALPPPPASAGIAAADPLTLWAIVILIETIKAVGLFVVGAGQLAERRQPTQVTPLDAARALARKRWGEPITSK